MQGVGGRDADRAEHSQQPDPQQPERQLIMGSELPNRRGRL
jgi:hypothetical protein